MRDKNRNCPACGNSNPGILIHQLALRTADDHPLQGGYPVVSCPNCGCGYAEVFVDSTYYKHYYANLAKYASEPSTAGSVGSDYEPAWIVDKANASAERVSEFVGSKNARILDVGCATGSLLAGLHRIGYRELFGIDPSPGSVASANTRAGIHARVGSFSEMPTDLGIFDCICLTGVLEHVWDVDQAVLSLLPLLNSEGIIYIEVPDALRYLNPYVAPFEDFSTEHVNHFSFNCLQHLSSRNGLETVKEISVEVALSPGIPTAIAAVAWQRGDDQAPLDRLDDGLEAELRRYRERSMKDFVFIEELLESDLGSSEEFILWGIGETAFKLLALKALSSRKAIAYVDGNPARLSIRFGGDSVIQPSEISRRDVPIVVSSLVRADSIVAAADHLGLPNPIIRVDRWRV